MRHRRKPSPPPGEPLFPGRRTGPNPLLAVRIEESMKEDLERVAGEHDSTVPDVVRGLLRMGLLAIRAGLTPRALEEMAEKGGRR